jgi:hypothetical protein
MDSAPFAEFFSEAAILGFHVIKSLKHASITFLLFYHFAL